MAYAVPPLPYDYNALEPHIDEQTMRIHHDKHHQAYVDKVNAALEGTDWADRPIEEVLTSLDRLPDDKRTAVRNNGGGHFNHTLFWESMGPGGGGAPERRPRRSDRRGLRLLRGLPGQAQGRRRQPVRLRLGLARPRRRRARSRLHRQSGQPHLGRQDAAARRRRLGARLLPQLPEPAPRLHRRLVEHGRLGDAWPNATLRPEMPALKIVFVAMKAQQGWKKIPPEQRRAILEAAQTLREEARAHGRQDGQGSGPDRCEAARPSAPLREEAPVAARENRRGVADGTRTHDHRDHNPGLYQLSYRHREAESSVAGATVRPGACSSVDRAADF